MRVSIAEGGGKGSWGSDNMQMNSRMICIRPEWGKSQGHKLNMKHRSALKKALP